jgi:hypothetical protein
VRQGQQNRRGRGRNRKSQNPLARSFESNGPDVKIRGTPAHIAEKYMSLARDAQSSGDPVLAENFLQHAEHYNRIIMAYRDQLQQPGEGPNGNGQRMRMAGPEGPEDYGDDEGEEGLDEGGFQPPPMPQQAPGPSPSHSHHRQHGGYEGNRPYRRDHGRHRDRHEGRPQYERPQQENAAEGGGEPRRRERERFQQVHEQPDFLRRPVRRVRSEGDEPGTAPGKDEPRE